MGTAFRKISRVGSLTGATKWYLSDDCLLAAKRVLYAVEYRRFYLRDLESVVVWPNRTWWLRPLIPCVLFGVLSAVLWNSVNVTVGAIVGSVGLAWAALELTLGPTAASRIRTTGATVDLPVVKRTRRARRVLSKIEGAVRAARAGVIAQPIPRTDEPKQSVQSSPEANSSAAPVADLT